MIRLISLFIILLFAINTSAQVYEQKPPRKTRILFLLDGSGSMLAPWGPTLRINAAKRFLADFVDSLKVNDELELALRVYGHQYHRRYQRCDDSKLEVGFRKNNHQEIIQHLNRVEPKGTTPIAYSLSQAANDFPREENVRNIIIIITDGIESCEGDPCEVSLELQKRGIFLKPFIIGIGMEQDYTDAFGCMGKFYDARNLSEFRTALEESIYQTLDRTTVSVDLLDQNNQPTISNINVTFINDFTNEPVYEFIHYRDGRGRPDSVEVDAVLSYDIRVNTVPPVYQLNPTIIAGEHNIIKIQCPQGKLMITQKNHNEYKKNVEVLVYEDDDKAILHTLDVGQQHDYLMGTYDIEITTLPRIRYENVYIKPGELVRIDLPAPGVLNIKRNFPGYGSLYLLMEDGSENWIYNLESGQLVTSVAMQPGKYKLVFRADNAHGSKFTKIREFEIAPGKTVDIEL